MSLVILMASDFYPPFIGGLERQTAIAARELAGRGHQVTVATTWHPGLPETETHSTVRVRRLKGLFNRVPWLASVPGRRYHPPLPTPAWFWRCAGCSGRRRPTSSMRLDGSGTPARWR